MDLITAYIKILEIGADVLGKLVWPAAVVWIAWCFRGEVRDLAGRLSSAKLGDSLAVAFRDQLTRAKAQASELPDEDETPSSTLRQDAPEEGAPAGQAIQNEGRENRTSFLELISPPNRVVNAWDDVYRHLSQLYKQIQTDAVSEPRETTLLFTALYKANRLSSEQVALARTLYEMRNYALSGEGKNISVEAASEYEGVSQKFCLSLR